MRKCSPAKTFKADSNLSKSSFRISILSLGLLVLPLTANATVIQETAGICDPGEVVVVTHKGDATELRCKPDYSAPEITAPRAHAKRIVSIVPQKSPPHPMQPHKHHHQHQHQKAKSLIDVLTSIFRPHRR